jgi:hypothetical protein
MTDIRKIGIPYAYVGISDDGTVYSKCPVCGEKIPEKTDRTGEMTTNAYAKHYEREHDESA